MRSLPTGGVGVPFSARFHSARSGRHPDGVLVGGLRMTRMSDEFAHQPVMSKEIVDLLAPVPAGVVLDATVGGGGHAAAILDAHPHLSVVGIDQDPAAVVAAGDRLARFGPRAAVVRSRFDDLGTALAGLGVTAIVAALFDLGVSSPQLDHAGRGFSYRAEGPLDMRMDPDGPRSAADVVNASTENQLAALFAANGEGRFARRIARAVVGARPITTTTQFADVVRDAIPAATRRHGGHPAKRVFQAVRIAVNDELDVLPGALETALDLLVVGGRAVVLAYHSGEDRIVKATFRRAETGGCVCLPGLPCVCGAQPTVRLVRRGALKPGIGELAANRRAESARLRVVERLAVVEG
ncbi:MAG: 16S rRNA (cytosine(1402)-N(4))-methyltransferase RsmH [Actinomycetota bacterium]|nr:16S rRNA (cytosine(1402)-N(4))-methyltransferase RsmH [Actinomycetota bacterium]